MSKHVLTCLLVFTIGCGGEPPEPPVSTRNRDPLVSMPDARPILLADSVRAIEGRLQAVLASAESVAGVFTAVDTTLFDQYVPGAEMLMDPGNAGQEAGVGRGTSGLFDIADVDPAEEKELVPADTIVRAVFGADDRGTPQNAWPYQAIGKLVVDDNACSATLVGPRHILTASHCFLPDGEFDRAVFFPFYYRGSAPYGYANIVEVYGHLPSGVPSDDDFAVAVLDRRLGDELGWLGWNSVQDQWFASQDHTPPDFMAAGYSGDWYDGHVMSVDWGAWLYWRADFNQYIVAHDGDVIPGDSGGPVFASFDDGSFRIVGIIIAGPQEWYVPQGSFRPGYANWLVDVARFAGLIEQVRKAYP